MRKSDPNLSTTVELYQSLISYVEKLRSRFDYFFDESKSVYEALNAEQYSMRLCGIITVKNMDEKKSDRECPIFSPVIDSLIKNFHMRLDAHIEIDNKFSFLVKLNKMNELSDACKNIAFFYSNDVDDKHASMTFSNDRRRYAGRFSKHRNPVENFLVIIRDQRFCRTIFLQANTDETLRNRFSDEVELFFIDVY